MKKRILLLITISILLLMSTSCKKNYTVNFLVDGNIYHSEEIKKGNKVTKPIDPVKNNYLFVNWQNSGVEFNFDTKVKKNITLEAYFESSIPQVSQSLEIPKNLKLEQNVLTWDSINDAFSYDVYVDGIPVNVKTNKYTLPNNTYYSYIWVVSRHNNTISKPSTTILYRDNLTSDEFDEVQKLLKITKPSQKETLIINEVGLILKKLNVTIDEINGEFKIDELLNKYFESSMTNDQLLRIFSFGLFYLQDKITKDVETLKTSLDVDKYNNALQALFSDMVTSGGYKSSETLAINDDKFVNLVAPFLTDMYFGSTPTNAMELLSTYSYYQNYFKITRKDLTIFFENVITNERYSMTLEELDLFNDYYIEKTKNNNYFFNNEKVITKYHFDKLKNDIANDILNKYQDKYNLALYIKDDLPSIINTMKDLYEVFDIVNSSINNQNNNMFDAFLNAKDEIAYNEALANIIDFKNQVVSLALDKIPTDEAINSLIEFSEIFALTDITLPTGIINFDVLKVCNLLKDSIYTLKVELEFIKKITIDSYDYKTLISNISDITENPEFVKFLKDNIIYLQDNIKDNKIDIANILLILFDNSTEEMKTSLNLLFEEFNSDVVNELLCIIDIFEQDEEIFNILIDVVLTKDFSKLSSKDVIKDILSLIKKEDFLKYKDIIINLFEKKICELPYYKEAILNSEEYNILEKASDLYQLVYDNYDFLVSIINERVYFELLQKSSKDLSYLEKEQNLRQMINLAKSFYIKNNIDTMNQILKEVSLIVSGEVTEIVNNLLSIYNDELLNKLDLVTSFIGISESNLSIEQKKLIEEISYLGIDWIYLEV